jgi:asparagine synthase (glutamine-hydrolysing)
LEVRVPFFDRAVVDNVMCMDPQSKQPVNGVEKYILRKSFENTQVSKYIPNEILWRQKDAFSDAVGYNWIHSLKHYTSRMIQTIVDSQVSKEERFYKHIFTLFFDHEHVGSIGMWRPNWTNIKDPSATFLKIHNSNH